MLPCLHQNIKAFLLECLVEFLKAACIIGTDLFIFSQPQSLLFLLYLQELTKEIKNDIKFCGRIKMEGNVA
ncbi:hypothetical protein GGR42_001601 [Saonia flava]|uniref:Uncharacterized protein n=1 Tax=Saonia flava TaxID=523696 RepID=A0A846R2U5_9FLAO|nr:hypothetical protein [Saonia flava]